MNRKAEQKRLDGAQHDERFLSWVEMNEGVLELEFDEDVPDLPEKPWGQQALRIAEVRALEIFPSKAEVFDEEHWDISWRFVRFIGQTFIDAFDGFWVNLSAEDGARAKVVVELPFRTMYLEPINLLTAAMSRRTGKEWARVYGYAEEDYSAYRASKRKDNA